MARLKVFTWSDGFHAFTVAASSRPKALSAWGMSQDIFKSGLAREIEGGAAHDAALARPGEVVQTGEAVDPGLITKSPKRAHLSGQSAARKARVAELEKQLEAIDVAHEARAADLERHIAALTRQQSDLMTAHERRRRDLVDRLKAARAKA